jgi:hypothetical protein
VPSITQLGNAAVIAAGNVNTMCTYTEPIGGSTFDLESIYTSANGLASSASIAQVGNSLVMAFYLDAISNAGEVTRRRGASRRRSAP